MSTHHTAVAECGDPLATANGSVLSVNALESQTASVPVRSIIAAQVNTGQVSKVRLMLILSPSQPAITELEV